MRSRRIDAAGLDADGNAQTFGQDISHAVVRRRKVAEIAVLIAALTPDLRHRNDSVKMLREDRTR